MPDFHHLLLFIAAGLLLNLTPGPDVMFIVANAVLSSCNVCTLIKPLLLCRWTG